MKWSAFIVMAIFGSTACQAVGKPAPAKEFPSEVNRAGGSDSGSLLPVRLGFSEACTQSGGRFDSRQQLCDCPGGMSFSGWKEKCIPIDVDRDSGEVSYSGYPQVVSLLEGEQGQGRNEALSSAYAARKASYQIGSLASALSFTVLTRSSHASPRILRSLRGMLSEAGFFIIPRQGYRASEMVYFAKDHSQALSLFRTPKTSLLQALPPYEGASKILEGGKPDELTRDKQDPLVEIISLLGRVVEKEFVPSSTVERVEGGCERYCELSQEFHWRDTDLQLTRTRVIAGGSLLKDWVKVWEDSSHTAVRAVAVFTPSGAFSHCVLYSKPLSPLALQSNEDSPPLISESSDSQEAAATYRIMTIYGSDLKPWGTPTLLPQPMREAAVKQVQGNSTSFDRSPSDPQVVVCESGLNEEFFFSIPSSHILRGPNQSSLFGWVKDEGLAEAGQGALFYSGVSSRNEFGVAGTLGDLSQHAQAVVLNLGNSQGQLPLILPIGISECLNLGSSWIGSVLKYSKAKVVSLSATDNYDSVSCANSRVRRTIEGAKGKLLWVVASGNDGLDLDREFNDACPATLRRDDVLVVASGRSDESPLDSFSNFGENTVDLAADGSSEKNPSSRATSFAAPRVASIAADIANRYPELTPVQIKKVLMLSAEINPWDPLPVRSGGFVSRTRALALAEYWVEHPKSGPKEALVGTFGRRSSVHQLVRFFTKKGLL